MTLEQHRAEAREAYEAAWADWQRAFTACWEANPGCTSRTVQEAREADPAAFEAWRAASRLVAGLFPADTSCPEAQALCAREGVDIGQVQVVGTWRKSAGCIMGRQGRWLLAAWRDDPNDEREWYYGHTLLCLERLWCGPW